jgi:thiol-disulfide isomerase/thioredoxin
MELNLPDLEGRLYDLDELRGKLVVVNFWASWCTPCIQEMPSIQRLADRMRDRPFAVIGVNVAEGERRAKTIAQRLGIGFPVLLDKDSAAFHRWGATVLPTTYVLDADGVIRYVGRGPLEWDGVEIVDLLEAMAAGEASAKE